MWASIHQLEDLLNTSGGHYIGGNNLSIADFLFYYELTNLQYFKCNHDKYDRIVKWYNRIDAVPEVKNIMKEWGPISKERSDLFYKIYPIKEKYIET
jgi:glutathione S-transferase